MKKSLYLLILVLLLSVLSLGVSAAQPAHPHQADHCVCGGSAVGVGDHVCADISWKPLPAKTTDLSTLEDGNYYLTGNLVLTGNKDLSKKSLNLCLNGYNINTSARSVFGYLRAASKVSICDCSGQKDADGLWSWGGTVTGNRTGYARLYGGIANVCANSSLNVYGGNFVGASGGDAANGAVFNVCNDYYSDAGGSSALDPTLHTRLAIYNGHITGGDVTGSGSAINSWHSVYIDLYGGTITGGTAGKDGSVSPSASTVMTVSNTVITDSAPAYVWTMQGDRVIGRYSTLDAALKKLTPGQHLRLTGSICESVTLSSNVVIDLAGNDLSGVTVADAIFIDSTTDRYNGDLSGKLTPASGAPKQQVTDPNTSRRYLAIEENGSYRFARFYLGITHLTLKPSNAGMGYKACFAGAKTVRAALSEQSSYGFHLWLDKSNVVSRAFSASRFGGTQELSLRLEDFLTQDLTDAENEARANMPVYASVFLRLSDGSYIESEPVCYTLRQMTELVNSRYESCTAVQKTALQEYGGRFSGAMRSWDIHNFHHGENSIWQEVTNTSFHKLLTKTTFNGYSCYRVPSGSYLLTEDIDLGSKSLLILPDANIDLCLNSFTMTGKVRMFRTYGNLNICDCHATEEEGTLLGTLSVDTATQKNYAPVIYCYYNSVTNLYGGHMKATGTLAAAGVVAISHDGDYSDPTQIPAVFNMYGGSISGGWVSGDGGNISIWNNGVLNIYGGTIYGGSAATGGGINAGQGHVNIYGGTIRDNVARAGNGGNLLMGNSGHLKLLGGTITGGTATAAIVDGEAQFATGLGGGIYTKKLPVVMEGDVQITGNTGSDLYLGMISYVDAQNLSQNARIGITTDMHGAISADPSLADRFISNDPAKIIATVNGKLALVPQDLDTNAVTATGSTFRVGYSITDMTPTESGLVMSSWGNPLGRRTDGTVGYPLNATVVALSDKENNTVLMITVDLQNPPEDLMELVTQRISQVTGVDAGNIYISATHTHNVPTPSTASDGNRRYQAQYVDALVRGAMAAMADRAPAQMSMGSFDTVGMNFTRHYYYFDSNGEKVYFGDQFGIPPTGKTIYRVRPADPTMHMLAFTRAGKQPVLITNWRAHPHRSGGKDKYDVNADVIGATRDYIHTNTEYLFAYYQGAAGNVNTTSRLSGETYKSGKIKEYGDELGRQIVAGMKNLKPVETGLIQTKKVILAANVDHSQDGNYEQAVALQNYYKNNPEEMDTLTEQITVAATYGFTSVFHATRLISKYNLPETKNMDLNIFSIGNDVAFYTAPAELWDSFSEELETLSPFETTFCIGYCNGNVAYIPYELDYRDSYEELYCLFTQPETITQMKEIYLENLKTLYQIATGN